MTIDELVNRFDDLVAAVERIADTMEQLADDVAKDDAEDREQDDYDGKPAE